MEEIYDAVMGNGLIQVTTLAVIISTYIIFKVYRVFVPVHYPRNLPRLGSREGISWSDMRKKYHTDCLAVFDDAYQNYSKKGLSVLMPVFGPHDEVILPPSSLQWLCKQPDHVVSSMEAQIDGIQLHYSLGHKFAYDPWGGMMVKSDLNSALETVCAVMNDELRLAFDAVFGTDTEEWKEIDLFAACRIIGGRATLRFTLGDSPEGRRLCADEGFLAASYDVLDGMLDLAGAMASHRKGLRPFLGPWASRSMNAKLRNLEKGLEPLWKERLNIIEGPGAEKDSPMPQDLIQMLLEYAVKERPKEAHSLADMTKRLAVSNFGTMHQTIISLHNIFLNVLDSDPEFNTMSVLRDEVKAVLGDGDSDTTTKHWTRAKVASMTRADSANRETMRVNSFIGRTVQRLVVAKEGLVTEDGIKLPQGTMVSILAHPAQTDAQAFAGEDPLKYDPFRFSRQREAAADPATGRPGLPNLSFASTSADYLPFSHGRHACPGRFLVDFEMKMILAYAVMNYDMEFPESYGGKRPPLSWFAGFGIPPLEAKIRVKRRKVAA